jgi:hypothetical protein
VALLEAAFLCSTCYRAVEAGSQAADGAGFQLFELRSKSKFLSFLGCRARDARAFAVTEYLALSAAQGARDEIDVGIAPSRADGEASVCLQMTLILRVEARRSDRLPVWIARLRKVLPTLPA